MSDLSPRALQAIETLERLQRDALRSDRERESAAIFIEKLRAGVDVLTPADEFIATHRRNECRFCGAPITLSDDGAWNDESGACGCGVGEHEPGGFSEAAHEERRRETPWWD